MSRSFCSKNFSETAVDLLQLVKKKFQTILDFNSEIYCVIAMFAHCEARFFSLCMCLWLFFSLKSQRNCENNNPIRLRLSSSLITCFDISIREKAQLKLTLKKGDSILVFVLLEIKLSVRITFFQNINVMVV